MRAIGCALVVAGVCAAAGCGEEDHPNRDRPPVTINVTAAIVDQGVRVSPRAFGAGPIRLIISNQTGAEQELTIATGGGEAGVTRTTSPIAPAGTATLEVDVPEGRYEVTASEGDLRPAALRVGAARPSAQDQLLLP